MPHFRTWLLTSRKFDSATHSPGTNIRAHYKRVGEQAFIHVDASGAERYIFLEAGYVHQRETWQDVLAEVAIEEVRPGKVYFPHQLNLLIEPYDGITEPNYTIITADPSIHHEKVYILEAVLTKNTFRANSSPPIDSETLKTPNHHQRVLANRFVDQATWYMMMAQVGKYRMLLEAAYGKLGTFEWLDHCKYPTFGDTYGVYTLLRYEDEATEQLPATLRYWFFHASNQLGIRFWELEIPSNYSPFVKAFMGLGRENLDTDSIELQYERRRLESYILSSLKPPITSGPDMDPPVYEDDQIYTNSVGFPIEYGFHLSLMGSRIAIVTRDPIYREVDGKNGIWYWDHRLYQGDIILQEELLYDENNPRAEFQCTWVQLELQQVSPPIAQDFLYIKSTVQVGSHVYTPWHSKDAAASYGFFGSYEAPFYVYFKPGQSTLPTQPDGHRTVVRYTRYRETSTAPAPPYRTGGYNWRKQAVRHPDVMNGAAAQAGSVWDQSTSRDIRGFSVWREKDPGNLNEEVELDLRGIESIDTANNNRFLSTFFLKLYQFDIETPVIENSNFTDPDWQGDEVPFNCSSTSTSTIRFGLIDKDNPWQAGNPNLVPNNQEVTYGTGAAYWLQMRNDLYDRFIVIFPSYYSEGVFLCRVSTSDDLIITAQVETERSVLQVYDNQTDEINDPIPLIPTYEKQTWAMDGQLSNSERGGGISGTITYIPPQSEVVRYQAEIYLLNQHNPIRSAERYFGIAPDGTLSNAPGITRILAPGEDKDTARLEEEGFWRTLYEINYGPDGEYYIDSFVARMSTYGNGVYTSDFTSANPITKHNTRGGLPQLIDTDVVIEGPGIFDPDDTDPPSTDPEVLKAPVLFKSLESSSLINFAPGPAAGVNAGCLG